MIELTSLNKQQRKAVAHVDGPAVVVAGAGTGKTRTIAFRAAYLIDRGIAPGSILAITFTNKASREMRDRISKMVGEDACGQMTVRTIHSLCVRILREDIGALGRDPSFGIFDTSDQTGLVRKALVAAGMDPLKHDPRKMLWRIGMVKNAFPDAGAEDLKDPVFKRTYDDYNKLLEKNNALDFDDLLIFAARLFGNKKVLKKYQDRFRYVMVDEFQDVNGVQYELVRKLAASHGNLYVVGDEDQSIYGWRGARVKNFLNFEKDFKGAEVIRLEQNYRSTATILNASNGVIEHNTTRRKKKLWSAGREGYPVGLIESADEHQEAESVIDLIVAEKRETKKHYGDFAILYRTNAQSRLFEERLVRLGVSYIMIGGTRFFERREIKDMTAYLRVEANREDDISLLRVINFPSRGIGKTSLERLQAASADKKKCLYDTLEETAAEDALPAKAALGIAALLALFGELREIAASGNPSDLLRHLMKKLEVRKAYEHAYADMNEAKRRYENVGELLNGMIEYERTERTPTLQGYLERTALMTDEKEIEEDLREDSVVLMTLHSAKGLEFRNVIIVGAEEGFLPHENCRADDEIEEERRLFYVGMTRARKRLFVSRAASRRRFGQEVERKPSRFIGEIPPGLVSREDNDSIRQAREETHRAIARENLDRIREMLDR